MDTAMSEQNDDETLVEFEAPVRIEDQKQTSGWHAVNIGHLVMGLAFSCFVGGWALIQGDVVTGDDIRWLLPIPWLVAGAVGLTAIAVSSARKHGIRR